MESQPASAFGLKDEDFETAPLSIGSTHEDTSNSERFVRRNKGHVYYSPRRKAWIRYDGQRWERDDGKEVIGRAKETAKSIYQEAATLNDEEAIKRGRWAERSLNRARVEAMTELAKPAMVVDDELFDANDSTVNCGNGTLNQHNGEFHRHRKEDFLTKLAAVDYDPTAECPRWQAFLEQTFQSNQPLIEYVQRVAGYFLTGSITEQVWFMFYGPTASGKSTLVNVLRGMLGEYALALPENYFLITKHENTDFITANLAGIRLATCIETNEGKRLNVARLKTMTGEDAVSACFKFENYFEFKPKCKLVLVTNYPPRVPAGDDALWRRLKVVPFNVTVPEDKRVPGLADKLLDEEGPGILRWAFDGCRAWQDHGLMEPKAVREAINAYRTGEDIIADFATECLILDANARTPKSEIYLKYTDWCKNEGLRSRSKKFLGLELQRLGIKPDTDERHYRGVRTRQLGDLD